ncbi:uncharacterized protein LOC129806804 [Phlebotomus papatasi]|uniref:uncharacterized protein LOC129806804 n=1 Tax=Phlebotomus papatasi TaxID=29031 RepID=UPI002483DE63|nr:uncharacterized protein LOC129806804 [Phlebotomus papatasi]
MAEKGAAQRQPNLKQLHRERGRVKGRLTRIETYLNSNRELFTQEVLSVHEENLHHIRDDFKAVQKQIYNTIPDEELDTEEAEEDAFDDRMISATAKIRQMLKHITKHTTQSTGESSQADERLLQVLEVLANKESEPKSRMKLPELTTQTFSGEYADWESFRDVFLCNIHNNSSLSDVQKFQYLKGLLVGKAKSAIKHLKVTNDNYKQAWQVLERRFSKKQNTVEEFIHLFMSQPTLKKQDYKSLRQMYDVALEVINGLNALNCEERDVWLIYIYLNKMDDETKLLWARENKRSEIPTFDKFLEFLDEHCNSLESIQLKPGDSSQLNQQKAADSKGAKPKQQIKAANEKPHSQKSFAIRDSPTCKICAQVGHSVFNCPKFIGVDPQQRLQLVQGARLCTNCFRASHTVESCKSSSCRQCHLLHNTLLHDAFSTNAPAVHKQTVPAEEAPKAVEKQQQSTVPPSQAVDKQATKTSMVLASTMQTSDNSDHTQKEILLPTISLLVMGADRRFYKCRTFYDSCSQPNLITKRFAERAFLQLQTTSLRPLRGVTPHPMEVQHTVTAAIYTKEKKFIASVDFVVVDEIADVQPTALIDVSTLIPSNIQLADPDFNIPGRVDMLLGAQLFWKTLRQGNFGESPEFRETAFGYIVSGTVPVNTNSEACYNVCFLTKQADPLQQQLEKFWTIEEAEEPQTVLSSEEQLCEKHFLENTTRDEHGRFIVRLPTRDNLHSIGDSKQTAFKRFLCVERRLQRNPALKEKYVEFMREYESLGHMRPAPASYTSNQPEIYLPHHAVVKTSSKTTPVRVVFDASARSSTNISLNSTLMVGPKTQEDLFQILLRFRQHTVAVKADIRKMFRQVRVHEDDQNMQRILWRESPDKPIISYLLQTVTYGTASASYLSTRCMQQLIQEDGDDFPLAKEAAARDFYVDDFMSGQDSVENAMELCAQVHSLMKQGGFELTKWMSSHQEVIQQFPHQDHEIETSLGLSPDDTVKALGLKWNPSEDTFSFDTIPSNSKVTKRIILSEISKVYDPLGLLTPVVITAKMLMQTLWQTKIDWDSDIEDPDILQRWTEYQQSIRDISQISIPRCITPHSATHTTQLIAFSDASIKGYAACIYIRTVTPDGEESCRLLCAKSRVAPIKQVTIPRLELCGAVLAVKLIRVVQQSLTCKIDSIHAYTDSMIVLHWLAAENPRKWKTFVANRVSDIQGTLSREHWDYVPSEHNPADIASRGTTARELANHSLWWHGPDLSVCGIQEFQERFPEDEVELEQRVFLTTKKNNRFWEIINQYSRFTKLVRVLAYCKRFIHNKFLCKRDNSERITGPLTVDELHNTKLQIIKASQQQSFPEDIHHLKQGKELSKASRIKSLAPFLDEEGILRVGGRIHKANLNYEQKHQILLHDKHHLTDLIAEKHHAENLHGGHQLVLASIRQQFWPLRGLDVVKRAARKCITCFKCKPQLRHQLMGNLPAERIQYNRPFSRVGIDFCGPFFIKPPLRRSAVVKVYVAVYVCFVTRAVHLELVHDLTSEAFIASLRRFCARRGKPSDIFCDNAKNFVGAAKQISDIHQLLRDEKIQTSISTDSAQQGIRFHFIPPRSPHFGGIWETAVKSFKSHLKRVAGNVVFTLESLETIIVEIEACLNSRPLCPMSNDPQDFTALTPGHFMVGAALNTLPSQDLTHIQQNRLSKWRVNEQILQHFWKRWHREILTSMQQRKKWQQERPNIEKGDLVIIQEDNIPPLKWPLGRVVDVHPGADNRVRVATVQTQDGIYKRAITRLAVLPTGQEGLESEHSPEGAGWYRTDGCHLNGSSEMADSEAANFGND